MEDLPEHYLKCYFPVVLLLVSDLSLSTAMSFKWKDSPQIAQCYKKDSESSLKSKENLT